MELGNLAVIVTGANSGIGFALTEALLERGHNVIAIDIEVTKLVTLDSRSKLHIHQVDISCFENVSQLVDKIKCNLSGPLCLVNNVGTSLIGPFEHIQLKTWLQVFNVNFFGAVNITQKCLPLIQDQGGRIIFIGSLMGRIALPYNAPYVCSKFALRGLSDTLRREFKELNIPISLVELGAIKTAIWFTSKRQILQSALNFKKINSLYELYEGQALQCEYAVKIILMAIEDKNPRAYYSESLRTKLQLLAAKLLPVEFLDFFISKDMKKSVKN
jgi:short-subunit dehydrogenase